MHSKAEYFTNINPVHQGLNYYLHNYLDDIFPLITLGFNSCRQDYNNKELINIMHLFRSAGH